MSLVFATPADLRARLQNPNLDDATAQAAIDSAMGLIRSLSGQTLDFVQGDVVELAGNGEVLTLPQRPVVVDGSNPLIVEELDVRGHPWPSTEGQFWYRQGDRLIRQWPTQWVPQMAVPWVRETSRLWAPQRPPGTWAPRVRVTYSHGYHSDAALPPGLKSIVLSTAAQHAINPGMLREEQVGGVRLQYGYESMRSSAKVLDDLKAQLRAIGLRRGGAFSIATV